MRRCAWTLCAAVLLGCPSDGTPAETDGAPPPPPPTSDAGSTTAPDPTAEATTTGAEPAEMCCEAEGDAVSCSTCSDAAQTCAARRTIGETPVAEDFLCQDACVPNDASAYWCADDTSCCDADATCDAQGFCRNADASSTGGASSTGAGSSTGDASSSTTGSEETSSTGDTESTTTGTME